MPALPCDQLQSDASNSCKGYTGESLLLSDLSLLTAWSGSRPALTSCSAVAAVPRDVPARRASSVTVGNTPLLSWCSLAAVRARSSADHGGCARRGSGEVLDGVSNGLSTLVRIGPVAREVDTGAWTTSLDDVRGLDGSVDRDSSALDDPLPMRWMR